MLIFVPMAPTASPVNWAVFIATALAVCISLAAEYAAGHINRSDRHRPRAALLQGISRKATFAGLVSGATGVLLYPHNIVNGLLAVTLYLLSIVIFARITQVSAQC
jgi:hypothetical protein